MAIKIDTLKVKDSNWNLYWDKIHLLQKKINSKFFIELQELATSKLSNTRKILPDILRATPHSSQLYKKSEALLLKMLKSETSPSVVASIGFANIDLRSLKLAKEMAQFANSKNSQVRFSVIRATDSFRSAEFLKILLAMTKDRSPMIREWAQFTIANTYVADKRMRIQMRLKLKAVFTKLSNDKNSAVRKVAKDILEKFYSDRTKNKN
ncbi:MAG: hypothetical protein JSU04_14395 [Bdellovibrionales bacterium]|nr:hypothetical protein [Bdellovibrionales bacterium]